MGKSIFGIIGNPVLHSLSPTIMNAAFERSSLNAKYVFLPVDSASEAIELMKRKSISGINVTAPFKEKMYELIESKDAISEEIGSVNTVLHSDNRFQAYNTDYYGIRNNIEKLQLSTKKALVLGTGGAAKAVCKVLKDLDFEFTLIGRKIKSLECFASKFDCDISDFDHLKMQLEEHELIISTLPNPKEYLNDQTLKREHILFDANYKDNELQELSSRIGFNYIRGLEWLIHQAIPAHEYFTNQQTNYEEISKSLANTQDYSLRPITLIGFMGVGKTQVGRKLAELLAYEFVDLDEEIEKEYELSIPEIFKKFGEEEFRKSESRILSKFLNKSNIIISCGGGLIKDKNNRNLLNNSSLCVWLDASVEYCLDGLDLSNRPLLHVENPTEKAKELYENRKELYIDSAHVLMNAEDKTVEEIAMKLKNEIVHIQ